MVSESQYGEREVSACKAVLLELVHLLGALNVELAKGIGHKKVQDVCARKARGCDLAFDSTVTITIEGVLPDGGRDRESFKVAGIVPFLVMKGMVMNERMKEKDAYDIYYCVEH